MAGCAKLGVGDAMKVLGLELGFTSEDLKKGFKAASLRHHPDKGGTHHDMVLVGLAWEVLRLTLADVCRSTVVATCAPPDFLREAAFRQASEFMRYLSTWPLTDRLHDQVMTFRNMVLQAANNCQHSVLMDYGTDVVKCLAGHVNNQSERLSWWNIGFKYLSEQGYGVSHRGGVWVDYGNCEYVVLLLFWWLERPEVCTSFKALQRMWPVKLDVWKVDKISKHVERLADVVEIIMGAARAEVFYQHIWSQDPYEHQLPLLFSHLIRLCKLVQELNARLSGAYLKHKREYVLVFCGNDDQRGLASLDFSRMWIRGDCEDNALLFHALICVARKLR